VFFNIHNQRAWHNHGNEGLVTGDVQVICYDKYKWVTNGSKFSHIFLMVHVVLAITSIVQGEQVFYSVPHKFNYFKTFTDEEKQKYLDGSLPPVDG